MENIDFFVETPIGKIDLSTIQKTKSEVLVLTDIKKGLIEDGLFLHSKKNEVCFASIAAFIMYLDHIMFMMSDEENKTLN